MSIIKIFCCISFSLGLLYSCGQKHFDNAIIFSKYWKFSSNDSTIYANKDYNDIGWDSLEIGRSWVEQGYDDHVGFGWYRKTIFLSSDLKSNYNDNDSVVIDLGIINNEVEFYLNGVLVSPERIDISKYLSKPMETANGIRLKKTKSFYKIAVGDELIKWDKQNLLAIRVKSAGEYGGMIYGVPFLYVSSRSGVVSNDKLRISFERFYKVIDQRKVDTLVVIKNNNSSEISSLSVNILAVNSVTNKNILSKDDVYSINGLDSLLIPVSLPISTDLILVYLNIKDLENKTLFKDVVPVPFVLSR